MSTSFAKSAGVDTLIALKSAIKSQRQDSLVKTADLQNAIFNSVNFSSIATDAQGVIQIFNVGAEKMLGYNAVDVVGHASPADLSDPLELITRADFLTTELGVPIKPGFESLVFKAARGVEDIYELTYICKDGSRLPAVVSVTALRNNKQEVIGYLLIGTDNSARKVAEASLFESERRFREMADTFPFVVWTAEPDGRTDYANQSFSAYVQPGQGSSSNVRWAQFVHPEDLPRCRDAWRTAIRTGQSYAEDYRIRRASSGDYHWHQVRAEPVRNSAGTIVKWYGTATDINATKLLEQRSTALAIRLDSTLESITDGFFILDSEGGFDFVNHQAARMFKSSREALLGKNFRAAFPQLVGSVFDTKCLEAVRDEMPGQLNECQLLSVEQWYDVSFFPSENGLTVYFRDVTQGRADLAQLHLLRKAVSRLNDIVLITEAEPIDESGPKIMFVNEAFERRTGYTQAEVIGQTPRLLQGPKTQRAELDRIRDALEAWQPVRAELINYTKAGKEFWLELDITPIADSKGWYTHWVAVERDITERKMAEEEILRLNTDLEDRVLQRTQQLEAAYRELEAFSYSVSHDLRSPLTTLGGFSQLLLKTDGNQLSEKGAHYLNRICLSVLNMSELMDGLVSLSKISRSPLIRRRVNLSEIASRLVQELRNLEPERSVNVDIQEGLYISGDPSMAAVVMQNLIGNAWKYSSKNQQAHIEIGSETLEDGTTCIFVKDNGAGFEMAYVDKLFQAFQRLHKDTDFKGTGIGLANVKRVVERHSGRVWATSKVGEGATFRFTLGANQDIQ